MLINAIQSFVYIFNLTSFYNLLIVTDKMTLMTTNFVSSLFSNQFVSFHHCSVTVLPSYDGYPSALWHKLNISYLPLLQHTTSKQRWLYAQYEGRLLELLLAISTAISHLQLLCWLRTPCLWYWALQKKHRTETSCFDRKPWSPNEKKPNRAYFSESRGACGYTQPKEALRKRQRPKRESQRELKAETVRGLRLHVGQNKTWGDT